MVLISLTSTSPPGSTKKSQRASPEQPPSRNDPIASWRRRATVSSGSSAGTISSMPPSRYLVSKSYQSASATISPGGEASTSSLPSSEHSTSRPSAEASTITRGSWRRASSTASSSSPPASPTRLMPTLEPSREGFTQSGSPISTTRSRQPSSPTAANSTWGRPRTAK